VIRLGALATAGGITFSFLLIALSLVILKWFGATLGWGIQFQQPWFLAGMATVTVLFAASFFELFPIAVPSSMVALALGRTHHLVLEAFLAGAFATLLATPCSAPFVGTAVGQASSFEHPIVSIGTAQKNGHDIGVTDILGHRNTTGVLGLSVGCESPPNPSRCILLSTLCRSFCWHLALALRLNAAVSADY
jgi:hypothetical protein